MKKKYLFLIKVNEEAYYDEFNGFVVCAFDKCEAQSIIFSMFNLDNFYKYGFTTSIIGEASDDIPIGIILSDYYNG